MADATQARLAELESERDRFREQARILGEQKAEWLCSRCDAIHPWRDGDRFTAACPDCGSLMVPTSVSARAFAEAMARADGAEAALALIHQTVVGEFLGMFGTSTLASFAPAIKLAWQVRGILDGSGVAARESLAETERERLRTHVHEDWTRCPACPNPGRPCACSGVPCCEMERREIAARAEAEQEGAELAETAAAERDRIRAALTARKVTLTRPGWGPRRPENVDVVPWEAVAEVLGGDGTAAAADSEALARARHLAKCWAGLPPDTPASLTLRHAGAEPLARIEGAPDVV